MKNIFLIIFITVFSVFLSIASVQAQSATLTAPVSGASYSSTMPLNYTVTDPGGTPVSIAFVMFNTGSSQTYTYDLGTVTTFHSSLSVTDNLAVPDGTYNVYISFVPFGGGPAVTSTTVTNVRFDRVTQSPSFTLPSSGLTTSGNFPLTYSLPEAASAVSLVFNNGSTDVTTAVMALTQSVSGTMNAKNLSLFYALSSATSFVIPDGTYTLVLSYQDASHNPAVSASISNISIDSVAPNPPTITSPSAGAQFNVQAVTIGGTAEVGSSVKVYDDGILQQTLTVGGSGNWSYVTSSLTEGAHNITATATDAALNVSSTSSVSFTYDATTPSAPIISSPVTRSTTTASSYQLSGTGDVGTTITIYDSTDSSIGTTSVDSGGEWQFTATSLNLGKNTFYSTAKDVAENESSHSTSVSIFKISGAPYAPLDITGDGFSDYVRSKRTASSLDFKWANAVTKVGGSKSIPATGSLSAIGDYNGDSIWEFGSVAKDSGGAVVWRVLSATDSVVTESFGNAGDAVLTGCNFDSIPDTELAYVHSNILSFKQFQGATTHTVTLPAGITPKAIRGCGDVDGDGIDEIFFEQKINKTKYVVAYSAQAQQLLKGLASKVATVFAGDFAKTSTKEMAVSYKPSRSLNINFFSSLAKQKVIVLTLPTSTSVVSGKCYIPGSVADCILYVGAKSKVFAYLPKTKSKSLVATLEKGYTLSPSRAVYLF